MSSPVANTTAQDWKDEFPITGEFTGADDLGGSNLTSIYWYDESDPSSNSDDGWNGFPQADLSESIVPGRGYRVFLRSGTAQALQDTIINLKGRPNMGAIDLNVTYSPAGGTDAAGWCFVGNPYPSAIDWDATSGWTKTNVDNAVYVWNALNGFYTTYINGVGTNGGDGRIASGQAFWVRTNANTPVLEINENAKISATDIAFSKNEAPEVLYVGLSDGTIARNTAVRLDENATEGFDSSLDAYYFGGDSEVGLCTYDNNFHYSINSLASEEQETLLYLVHPTDNKTYTLTFNGNLPYDKEFKLVDFYEGITTTIYEGMEYNFAYDGNEASLGAVRFALQVSPQLLTTTGDEIISEKNVSLFPNPSIAGETIHLLKKESTGDFQLSIVNQLGNTIENIQYDQLDDVINISTEGWVPGIYFITVDSEDHSSTHKLIIN